MKRDWTSRSALVIAGLIVVVLNLAGLNLFARLDLTDDKVYSLSEASISLVENLDDPVTIVVFFTADLPAPYSSNRRFIKDKLDDRQQLFFYDLSKALGRENEDFLD